jgi:hypothetical protein
MKMNVRGVNSLRLAACYGALFVARVAVGTVIDPVTELGSAANWAALSYGNVTLSNPNGYIAGNVGEFLGSFTDAGSGGVTVGPTQPGIIYLGPDATGNGLPTDTVVRNSTVPGAGIAAAAAAMTYYNGLIPDFTTAPSAGNVAPGVYRIAGDWSPNGGTYNLQAGQIYVFDITGNFNPSTDGSPLFINDATPQDVIFNIGGNMQTSGGGGTYPSLDGIYLAHGSVSLTGGWVTGEIISLTSSITNSSTALVDGPAGVPDGGSSLVLMGMGLGLVFVAKKRLIG